MTRFTICAAAFALALSTQVFSHGSREPQGRTVELQYKIYEIPFVPPAAGDMGATEVRSVNDRGEVLIATATPPGTPPNEGNSSTAPSCQRNG